jgi:RHS repeat-associated protein
MRDVAAGQSRVYHFDHQGTTQCLTDQTGAVTDRFASDAWGVQVKRTGSSINRQWYIGKLGYYRQADRTLDYVRARSLDVTRALWLSQDPILHHSRAFRYAYVRNLPTSAVDPTGEELDRLWFNVETRSDLNPARGRPWIQNSCGHVLWPIRWAVSSASSQKGGYVVQEVAVTGNVLDCTPQHAPVAEADSGLPAGLTYWEAWKVNDDGTMSNRNDDTLGTPSAAPASLPTEGCARVTGRAKYMRDYWIPSGWRVCVSVRGWAVNLRCTTQAPAGFDPDNEKLSNTVRRHLQVEWNCGCRDCQCMRCDWAPRLPGDERSRCYPDDACGNGQGAVNC